MLPLLLWSVSKCFAGRQPRKALVLSNLVGQNSPACGSDNLDQDPVDRPIALRLIPLAAPIHKELLLRLRRKGSAQATRVRHRSAGYKTG